MSSADGESRLADAASSPEPAEAIERRPVKPSVRDFLRIKVLSMGEGSTGKSCLIKRYCEQRFVSKYIATIGVDFGVRSVNIGDVEVKVNFWDLSGHPEFFDVRNEFYRDAQGAMLVYDVSSRRSFEALDGWLKEAAKYGAKDIKVVVCANKVRMLAKQVDSKKRAVSQKDGQAWAAAKGFRYFETSASSGENVDNAFMDLFNQVVAT